MVVEELNAIQHRFGYIPEKEIYTLSAKLNIPAYELFGVATFYPHYRMKPPPQASIRICRDFPCRLRGCAKLHTKIEHLAKESGSESVEIEGVSCLGQCDRAPAIQINDHSFAGKSEEELLSLVRGAFSGKPPHPEHFPSSAKGPFNTDPYTAGEKYGAVKELLKTGDIAGTIEKLKAAGLRGMGGAGFPTGIKWSAVRDAKADEKYVVCNFDEAEVGTFKDREICKNLPHLIVEGMILAAVVSGAKKGFIYVRHEYHDQIELLNAEIKNARGLGLVGTRIGGTDQNYELEVFVSPGGYVQGEESALLEAIEGRRGQPRVKPPFPVFVGLWGKPTIINNVETLAYVPAILVKGPEWFKAQGINGCSGLKWIGVSGHVNKPGVWEVPMGTTYREAIYNLAGGVLQNKKLKAFAPSGPSGGFLPASKIDLNMDFQIMAKEGSMLGSGAIVAIAEGTSILDLALNAVQFFRNESCGKCVPCRVGSQKMVDILERMKVRRGTRDDLEKIEILTDTLMMTSICGLGQVVPAPIQSAMKYFADEIKAGINS